MSLLTVFLSPKKKKKKLRFFFFFFLGNSIVTNYNNENEIFEL